MLLSDNFRSIVCTFCFEYFLNIAVLVLLGLDCTMEGQGRLLGLGGCCDSAVVRTVARTVACTDGPIRRGAHRGAHRAHTNGPIRRGALRARTDGPVGLGAQRARTGRVVVFVKTRKDGRVEGTVKRLILIITCNDVDISLLCKTSIRRLFTKINKKRNNRFLLKTVFVK